MKRSELIFGLARIPTDFVAIVLAFILAFILRKNEQFSAYINIHPLKLELAFGAFLESVILIAIIWVLVFLGLGLYNPKTKKQGLDLFWWIFVSISVSASILFTFSFLTKIEPLSSRFIVLFAWVFSIIFVFLSRLILSFAQKRAFKYKIGVYHVFVVGQNGTLKILKNEILNNQNLGYKFVGDASEEQVSEKFDILKNIKRNRGLDELIHIVSNKTLAEKIIEFCEQNRIKYRFVPNMFESHAKNLEALSLANIPLMEIKKTPLDGWGRIVKRVFDLFVSLILLIILAPLFLLVSVIIKITDPGVVFYKHKRIGRDKKELFVYKFRSMKSKFSTGEGFSGMTDEQILLQEFNDKKLVEEFKKNQKLKNDPRVSKIGKFLRKTSIDELPQLLNVLKGEMSLVGPRPIVENELEKYGEGQYHLFEIKPGMTGMWQASGRSETSYEDRIRMDIFYIENWSLLLDIKILFKTIPAILRKQGAY